jgi:hypothetical protein
MTKPIEKVRRPLIHHPSDVLDAFCHYDSANRRWREFDMSVSHQLLALEFDQRNNIRVRPEDRRQRST